MTHKIVYNDVSCRKREGSEDSGKMTPQMQEMKISMLEKENYTLSNKTDDNDAKNVLLEQNLRRFEEERRQFEREKLKFLEDKRELDRLRLQRFERYKRELEAKRLGIRPNYDIDNRADYLVARKLVIDYKMNDSLMASAQESGSDSEPDITVVENLQKKPPEIDSETQDDIKRPTAEVNADNEIKANGKVTDELESSSKNHLNGNELPNGMEKSFNIVQEHADADVTKMLDTKLEKVVFDETNPMRLLPFCKLLLREAYVMWKIHKRLHAIQWQRIKSEINKCLSELLMLMMFCGMGGLMFRYIEGNFETMNKSGVKRVKRDFIDQLWLSSHNLR